MAPASGFTGSLLKLGNSSNGLTITTSLFDVDKDGQIIAGIVPTQILQGGTANPGNSKYYGTDSGGTKGFFDLPSGGGGSGITIGTTAITSGTDGRIPFNDGGVVGEDANLFWNKTNNVLNILSTASDQAGLRVVREYTDESNWSGVTFLGNYAGTNDPAIISTKAGTGTQRNLWIGTAGSGSVIFFTTGAQSMRINPSGSVDFNFDVFMPDLYIGLDGTGAQHKIILYNNTDTNGVTLRGRPNILEVRNEAVDEYRDVVARDYFFSGATVRDTSGAGSPEGAITANIGSTYRRTDGGASTSLYVKESGTGNTGWVAYGAAGGGGITALTGDVTASGSGSVAATIANGVVTNAMLAGSIAYSKLSLTGAILNADLAGSIALSKLSITGTPDGTKFLRDDGSWQAAGGGSGATVALDNLASVAINTSLISDTDNTDDLGSSAKTWAHLFLGSYVKIGGIYIEPSAINGSTMAIIAGDFNTYRSLVAHRVMLGADDSTGWDVGIGRAEVAVAGFETANAGGAGSGTWRAIAKTPAQITSNQNNYNPGGKSYFQRWSTDASRDITGLTFTAAQVDGQVHVIINVGSTDIVLKNESASSTAANRFKNSTGADITLTANQSADLIYDGTASRWLVFKRN